MNVYIETSVILRLVLSESNPMQGWGSWDMAISSELSKVEVWRALHRLHVLREVSDQQFLELGRRAA